jgi:uncharacterized protein (DUF305 family)
LTGRLAGTPRSKIILGVLAVVVSLLIGYVAGWLTPRLTDPGEHSAEAGFARDMSTHHAQAVEMGMLAHRQATTPGLRTLGGDIALTQQAQIGMMDAWLADWGLNSNSDDPPMAWMPDGAETVNGNLMPGMATREEIKKLEDAQGTEFDVLFLQYMLRHHLGGIHMASAVLDTDPEPEVRSLAETMIRNQSGEIDVLKTQLTALGAHPLP